MSTFVLIFARYRFIVLLWLSKASETSPYSGRETPYYYITALTARRKFFQFSTRLNTFSPISARQYIYSSEFFFQCKLCFIALCSRYYVMFWILDQSSRHSVLLSALQYALINKSTTYIHINSLTTF